MNSTNALSKNSIFKNNRNNISNSNILKDEKKLLKCQINKQSKNKLLNNFHPESVNKYYSNNISHLNTKNKNKIDNIENKEAIGAEEKLKNEEEKNEMFEKFKNKYLLSLNNNKKIRKKLKKKQKM